MGQIISAFLAIFIGEQPKEDVKALVEDDRQHEENITVENNQGIPDIKEISDTDDKEQGINDDDLSFNFELKESKEEETVESVQKENFDNTLDLIKGADTEIDSDTNTTSQLFQPIQTADELLEKLLDDNELVDDEEEDQVAESETNGTIEEKTEFSTAIQEPNSSAVVPPRDFIDNMLEKIESDLHTKLEKDEKVAHNLLEQTQEYHTANDVSVAHESMFDGEYKTMDLIEEDIIENIPPSESYIDIENLKTGNQIPASSSSVFAQKEERIQNEPEGEPETIESHIETIEEPKSSFTLKISKQQEKGFIEEPDVNDNEKESIPNDSDHETENVDMSSPMAEIKAENDNTSQVTNEILNKQLFVESPEVAKHDTDMFNGDFSTKENNTSMEVHADINERSEDDLKDHAQNFTEAILEEAIKIEESRKATNDSGLISDLPEVEPLPPPKEMPVKESSFEIVG